MIKKKIDDLKKIKVTSKSYRFNIPFEMIYYFNPNISFSGSGYNSSDFT